VRNCSPRNVAYTQDDADIYPGGPAVSGLISMDQVHSACGGTFTIVITDSGPFDIVTSDYETPLYAYNDNEAQVSFTDRVFAFTASVEVYPDTYTI